MLAIGDVAPDFALPDQTNQIVHLSQYRGHEVVLYFYPEDDTPGCTKEACDFRDNLGRIKDAGAIVLGVSGLDAASKARFASKYSLPFTLLADEDFKVSTKYGVYGERSYNDKTWMGIERTTFLLDKTGKIVQIWHKVNVEGHVDEVLKALETARSPSH